MAEEEDTTGGQPSLSPGDVLVMTADELRTELNSRGKSCSGLTKPELQLALLTALNVVHVTDMSEQHISAAAVAVDYEVFSPITSPAKKDNEGSRLGQFAGAQSTPAQNPMELKIQLRRLEIEADIKRLEIEREREREEREHRFDLEEKRLQSEREERIEERQKAREHELALKQLELNAQQAIPPREQTPAFRVESAMKLIPKFNEHDIETFSCPNWNALPHTNA